MRTRPEALFVAALFAAFTITTQPAAQADTFGTSGNEFTIDFVNIGNAGNAADTRPGSGSFGRGSVPYEYRVGKYEITRDAITNATASGMADVTAGPWSGNQPAAEISWYEAAAFVNWLNTSTGNQAAYNLTFSGSWSMTLWSSADAWQLGGENLYRNKDAFYFLPSDDEWYKAAYYIPDGTSEYFLYPTASSFFLAPVPSGTNAFTAVWGQSPGQFPAIVDSAGGLSPYGTMGQGGNVWEWNESAFDGSNNSPSENRATRGGNWFSREVDLRSTFQSDYDPSIEFFDIGFRVASVPEPSTYALLLMTGAGALWWARRRR